MNGARPAGTTMVGTSSPEIANRGTKLFTGEKKIGTIPRNRGPMKTGKLHGKRVRSGLSNLNRRILPNRAPREWTLQRKYIMENLLDRAAAQLVAPLGTLPRTACSVKRLKTRKEERKATRKASKALAKAKRAKASRKEKEKAKVRKEKESLVEYILVKKLNTTTVQVLLRPLHGC